MDFKDESIDEQCARVSSERQRLRRLEQLIAASEVKASIIHLLLLGFQRKQIAVALRRSSHTVDGHLKELYRELHIGDRAQLMMLANQLKKSPPPNFGGWRERHAVATLTLPLRSNELGTTERLTYFERSCMTHQASRMLLIALIAITVPVSAVLALSLPDSAKLMEGGVCTDLGCKGGTTKCADGTLTLPSGGSATYTCYTTIADE